MEAIKYAEIFKLKRMLEDAEIPFVFIDKSCLIPVMGDKKFESYQIEYPDRYLSGKRVCSVIEGYGTYGNEQDRLEIMGLLTSEEQEYDSVLGYLTAEEVFARIKEHYDSEVYWGRV